MGLFLSTSVVCILPVFFSGGWTRWVGVVLFGVFMGFAWLDAEDGKREEQRKIARELRLEEKRKMQESKGFEAEKASIEKN